ncbi:MAG: NAD(P)-dependent oxidoreductase [Bacteroidota bacterium]
MNIIVTGSNGFIGHALVEKLQLAGHRIFGFDVGQGDITEPKALDIFSKYKIHHLFHLAGKTFVPESWKNPQLFYRVNIMGTIEALRYCRDNKVSLTYISSYLYGKPEYLPIDEQHPLSAYNPYSHSKLSAEQIVRYFSKEFNIQTTIFRPFNAYGPGQPKHFLIPEIIAKALDPENQMIEVNDLRPKRDYIFIDDLVEALLRSLSGSPGIYNVGSGYSTSVQEIICETQMLLNSVKQYRDKGDERPNEIFDLFADISLIKSQLGWEPRTTMKDGLTKCIEFNHHSVRHDE